eukprot:c17119_g2_i2 orf=350-634(+)
MPHPLSNLYTFIDEHPRFPTLDLFNHASTHSIHSLALLFCQKEHREKGIRVLNIPSVQMQSVCAPLWHLSCAFVRSSQGGIHAVCDAALCDLPP